MHVSVRSIRTKRDQRYQSLFLAVAQPHNNFIHTL